MKTYNIEIREFNGIDYDVLYPITTVENVNGLAESLSQIGGNIDTIYTDINNLDQQKQDKADLGSLAFKTQATLTNGADVSGVLPIANGGTGNSSGNASTATKLQTARTIQTNLGSESAPSFDGSGNVSPGVTGTLPPGHGGTGLTSSPSMLTNLASTSADNVLKAGPRPGVTGILGPANGGTGNSNGTVGKLTTARTIQTNLGSTSGASFDGSANVSPGVTGILGTGNGGTGNNSGNAPTATKLQTARTIQTNLGSTSSASFDGSANVTPGITGTLGLANGGLGVNVSTNKAGARSNLGITDIAIRPNYVISTTPLTPGTSSLATGTIYFYYEA